MSLKNSCFTKPRDSRGVYTTPLSFNYYFLCVCVCFGHFFTWQSHFEGLKMRTFENKFQSVRFLVQLLSCKRTL